MENNNQLQKINKGFKVHALVMLGLLIIQFILGMVANLYSNFPEPGQEGKMWEYAWSQPPIALHILIGLLVLLTSIEFMVRALLKKTRVWGLATVVGFVGILAAGVTGSLFIPSQVGLYSLIMAIGFLVSCAGYAWGLYAAKGEEGKA